MNFQWMVHWWVLGWLGLMECKTTNSNTKQNTCGSKQLETDITQLAPNLYYGHHLNDGLWCWCYNVLFVRVLHLIKTKNQISSLVYAKGKKEIFH